MPPFTPFALTRSLVFLSKRANSLNCHNIQAQGALRTHTYQYKTCDIWSCIMLSVCNCCFCVLSRYTLFFAGRLVGKKRSILIMGPSDTGKSFFGSLVRYQLPRARVFLPLAASEFCRDELNPMHILGFSNDWRFSQKVPTQPCLNWLEGLEFKYNRKHQKAGEGRGPLCIFTSNEMDKGWSSADIAAFYARMACVIWCFVKMEMVGVKENQANARVEKCVKCGACALLLKSNTLQEMLQKNNPEAFAKFDYQIKLKPIHYGAAQKP